MSKIKINEGTRRELDISSIFIITFRTRIRTLGNALVEYLTRYLPRKLSHFLIQTYALNCKIINALIPLKLIDTSDQSHYNSIYHV
jgi:hypothetical protein